jgi:thiamine phosphate synthase YjbQ (UPF0047 family)
MKSYTEYMFFCTRKHREYINITDKVEEVVKKSGIQEGMVLVSAMHITAGVYVNDAEEGLFRILTNGLKGWLHINLIIIIMQLAKQMETLI